MPNKILIAEMDGTPEQIVFADHATDFSPASAGDLRVSTDGSNELDVQLDATSLSDGAARQSAKFDFGANWARAYVVRAGVELAATPTAGAVIELYMGYSQSVTAGNGNPANLSGSDAAYTGYSSNLADSVEQLHFIGQLVTTVQATGTVQYITMQNNFMPRGRYGILVVKNECGAAFHSDAVETHIVFDPIVDEVQ